jgi:hypothetical protein
MASNKATIAVFEAEREAGIDALVRSTASIAYCTAVHLCSPDTPANESAQINVGVLDSALASEYDSADLHSLKSLLATTTWNKNDDVFLVEPTWNARATAEDKPFNYGHVCNDIIGHITSSYAVDDEGKAIDDATAPADLPAKFHIVTGAVLYKVWADDKLQERMDRILAEIAENKWFVSMECLFAGFDYAIQGETCEVVARNDQTAFLTKHLRAYGGKGVYQGKKVGRVLRDFAFSGKGLVAKPANPDSIIFENDDDVIWSEDSETAAASVVSRATASQTSQVNRDVARFFARP